VVAHPADELLVELGLPVDQVFEDVVLDLEGDQRLGATKLAAGIRMSQSTYSGASPSRWVVP